MPVAAPHPVERVVLRDISWEFYERLLGELGDSPGTRVTFDNGLLQIKVISAAHDNPNRTLATIVEVAAEETDTDVCHLGSTTFKRPDLLKGFEPDSCFYFQNAGAVRAKDNIDLTSDPPPELVIEVDVSSNSLDRFPIFAAVGVAEVWRYANGIVSMYALRDGGYQPIPNSLALPVLTAEAATRFADSYRRTKWPAWVAGLRDWVRSAAGKRQR
jgi:Uma2 family endonuclease